ncbi:multidrug resistance pump, putative [Ricinus communis]|uniref:Multidrug resistance pump, putative n=1 Tax=Ricinus communis TaxID=3988 RepID=B9RJS0_RICCO|nr:multidrug resistance pump, putative [Ricinus communis]
MNIIAQGFAGHLGDVQLASMSIANTVIIGFNFGLLGIWGGMIVGGTFLQTEILAIITIKSDWEKEAEKARARVAKRSCPHPDNQSEDKN